MRIDTLDAAAMAASRAIRANRRRNVFVYVANHRFRAGTLTAVFGASTPDRPDLRRSLLSIIRDLRTSPLANDCRRCGAARVAYVGERLRDYWMRNGISPRISIN